MKCKHKYFGFEGTIKNELKGNDKFPDQWGIYWDMNSHEAAKLIKTIGVPYYWNDKENIEVISK